MTATQVIRAANGRALGKKGISTRQAILEALEAQVRSRQFSELSISDLVEQAGVSMATFYIYFDSLETAVLGLVTQPKFKYREILDTLATKWLPGQVTAMSRGFVKQYFDFWTTNLPVLRLRNLLGDEGDPRFIECRLASALPVLHALAEKLSVAKSHGNIPYHVPATAFAAVYLASLERNGLTWFYTQANTRADLEEASAMTLVGWLAPEELVELAPHGVGSHSSATHS